MAKSLLAHLYTHIKGSQEDIATLSLQYLLMQSPELNKTFTKNIAKKLHIDIDEVLRYSEQVVGEENERPDMVGIDVEGTEIVLCEMKFYAALTPNQPLGYLDRLKKNNGKGLLFICPKSRISSLWLKLLDECEKGKINIADKDDFYIKADGVSFAVITWNEVTEWLINTATSVAEEYLGDIKQLKGYCEEIDSDAFIPFVPGDLTAEVAKKAERYYSVIDGTVNQLLYDETIKTDEDRRKASTNRNGYTRWIYVDKYGLSLCYDRLMWKYDGSVDTPFWLLIRNKKWEQTPAIVNSIKAFSNNLEWGYFYLPLEVPVYATEDEVCENLKKQILNYIDYIDSKRKKKH